MLGINDLKRGLVIVVDGEPFRIMTVQHTHIGRGSANVQAKVRSVISGKIFDKTFKPADTFEEAEIRKEGIKFIYSRNGEFWFHEGANPSKRFSLSEDSVGDQKDYLKPDLEIKSLLFRGEIIGVEIPVKVTYEVSEAPPNIKGNTAQGGNKQVTIETGLKISTPMFIETGDRIVVNTDTGEYVERG